MLCTQHLQKDVLMRLPLRFPPKNYTNYLRTFKGLTEIIYFVWVLFFFRKLILLPLENSLAAMPPDGNNSNSHTFLFISRTFFILMPKDLMTKCISKELIIPQVYRVN